MGEYQGHSISFHCLVSRKKIGVHVELDSWCLHGHPCCFLGKNIVCHCFLPEFFFQLPRYEMPWAFPSHLLSELSSRRYDPQAGLARCYHTKITGYYLTLRTISKRIDSSFPSSNQCSSLDKDDGSLLIPSGANE